MSWLDSIFIQATAYSMVQKRCVMGVGAVAYWVRLLPAVFHPIPSAGLRAGCSTFEPVPG